MNFSSMDSDSHEDEEPEVIAQDFDLDLLQQFLQELQEELLGLQDYL